MASGYVAVIEKIHAEVRNEIMSLRSFLSLLFVLVSLFSSGRLKVEAQENSCGRRMHTEIDPQTACHNNRRMIHV